MEKELAEAQQKERQKQLKLQQEKELSAVLRADIQEV